ncbi:hypothetical protein F5884DRAFT_349609 [Xylogone sp. PMI_703]|nr:hypothetical protein F5884DRAFT_349609 [Xylogone sp. PMI_703]
MENKPTPPQDGPPFRCSNPSCQKKFLRREHLTRHEQNHNSEKPYKCDRCSKAFSRSDVLRRHVALHDKPGFSQRTRTACSNCRSAKLKCDANIPCARCLSNQQECERGERSDLKTQSPGVDVQTISVAMVDMSINNFGSRGWCPGRSRS